MFLFKPNVERLEEKRDVPGLLRALKHSDEEIAASAADALGRIGDSSAVAPLVAIIMDRNAPTRIGAARSLGRLRDFRAVEPLIALLKDQDKLLRMAAAEALGSIGNPRAVKPLIEALADMEVVWPSTPVRLSAVEALTRIGDTRAVEPFIRQLRTPDPGKSVHRAVIRALGAMGDPSAIQPLTSALRDDYRYVREDAAEALAKFGRKLSLEDVLSNCYEVMRSDDERSRCDAASEILEKGGIEGLRLMLKALTGSNRYRYLAASWALTYDLNRYKGDAGDLASVLRDAMPEIIRRVQETKPQSGVNQIDEMAIRTLNLLELHGDASVLPALRSLLGQVKSQRDRDGYRKEYVQTASYGGWVDNDAAVKQIESVIGVIESRTKSSPRIEAPVPAEALAQSDATTGAKAVDAPGDAGGESGPAPDEVRYWSTNVSVSLNTARQLISEHGRPAEVIVEGVPSEHHSAQVHMLFDDGYRCLLGIYAAGYSGSQPEFLRKTLQAAGFDVSSDDVENMKARSLPIRFTKD